MTYQEAIELLEKINNGFIPTDVEKDYLSSIKVFTWDKIEKLPESIGNLTNLQSLNLSGTQINTLPESIGNLLCLQSLDLSSTQISTLPESIGNLSGLQDLNLSSTQISMLPETIGKLPNLKYLYLENLTLVELPESLLRLNLEYKNEKNKISNNEPGIYIHGLSLQNQPIEIFSQSREHIIEYYESIKSNSAIPINECKVVFLGDGGAGKSLIIDRLMNDGVISYDYNGESTPGISISSKEYSINNEKITLHFWDFGEQAILHSMHRLFLTKRTLYVVVTNARDNKQNEQAWYWIRNIKSFANGAPVLLLVNQKDQNPSASVNVNGLQIEYPELKQVRIVSALKDTKEEFDKDICDVICQIVSEMETVHTPFPHSWLSLMNNLQEMPEDYITSDEFYLKCQKNGVGTKAELLDQIIRWYQDLGGCFYSAKHPLSKQYMVLKPRWLLNALYILAFNGREYAKNGIITETDIYELICKKVSDENIKKVWPEIRYKPHEIQYIINVLLNFNLIYRLDSERFFIPMLCDENEPKEISSLDSEDSVHISFEYQYLPENVLHRLMVRHGYELDTNVVWRTGAIFERRKCGWTSLVRIRDNRLDVYATTENQKEHPINSYLDMMRESVYEINRGFGLQADEYIFYRRDGKEERFKFRTLVGSRKTGIRQVYSEVFDQPIDIEEILGILNRSKDEQTKAIVEQMLSVLKSMSGRSVDLYKLDEPALTRTFQSEVEPVLNAKFGIQIAREYTLGRAKKTIGETNLYFFSQKDGIKQEWYILENKVIENFSKQYEQLMGYINPNFKAGITLSINKDKEWEEAFDYICEKLDKLKEKRGEFAPILIDRKIGTNGTRYVKSEHIVPETGHTMPVYHFVMQLCDSYRYKESLKARREVPRNVQLSSEKKFPVGLQSFEKIRTENYYYVDKTRYIYQLVHYNVPYFLSRPRRFGKSLLLSTMKAYWEGKKELFSGLAIEKLEAGNEYAWQEYPIFHFDFNGVNYHIKGALEETLNSHLKDWEVLYGINEINDSLSHRLQTIIVKAYKRTGLRCVVLVDEYDKPILDIIEDTSLQKHNKDVFKGFFSILKKLDDYIHFIFITGVTKFHKVSIFSDLNQLNDISMDERYAGICGITENEIVECFLPEIDIFAQKRGLDKSECFHRLRKQYDGYYFHREGVGVYNPFSLLKALDEKDFRSYWFETGTPTFLVKKLKETEFDIRKFTNRELYASERQLIDYTGDYIDPIPMLFQTGYLSIIDFDNETREYTLSFPNDEVKYGFIDSLISVYINGYGVGSGNDIFTLRRYIENGETDQIKTVLMSLFASITYTHQNDPFEHYFQTVIFLVFTLLNKYALCEMHTNTGRIDCVVQAKKYIYIFEFKRDETAKSALIQINKKSYTMRFKADNRTIIKVGANFDSKTRNIDGWLTEIEE